MDSLSLLVVSCLQCLRQLHHALNGVFLQKIFVVKVIVEHVKPLLCVVDMGLESWRSTCFHTLEVGVEDLIYRLCICRNLGSIARRYSNISAVSTYKPRDVRCLGAGGLELPRCEWAVPGLEPCGGPGCGGCVEGGGCCMGVAGA